jgi:thioredoxin reductase (NADPH)
VVYLASQVAKVWMIVRGADVGTSMSRYLVDRIAGLPNVEVRLESEVTALEGHGRTLEAVRWRHVPTGEETRRSVRHLFLFIGAEPNTGWLARSDVALDDKGFVRTGFDGRRPFETSRDGIFAVGDVRAGSVKRVAAAVGEGSQVVTTLHGFLAESAGGNHGR